MAGHLGLERLIVLYDDNAITIDGSTDLAFGEDVPKRFEACGWRVLSVDGHDCDSIRSALSVAKEGDGRPTLICCRTVIGKGSPNLGGSNKTHGAPLGPDEVAATKEALGMDPDAFFVVPEEVRSWFRKDDDQRKHERLMWEERLNKSEKSREWNQFHSKIDFTHISWPKFEVGAKLATRKASAAVLNAAAEHVGQLLGGSADLAGSNGSTVKGGGDIQAGDFGKEIFILVYVSTAWPPSVMASACTAESGLIVQHSWFFMTTCGPASDWRGS